MSRRKEIDRDAIMQTPRGAALITGYSVKMIRDGCRNGTIPCVHVGQDFRVHMPLFLTMLEEKARAMTK